MSRLMFDSVDASRLPRNAGLVACYLDGRFANEAAVRADCANARLVTITVFGHVNANVGDVENGDMSPAGGAAWARWQMNQGRHPTLYCNLSTWPVVQQAVRSAGMDPAQVSWWIADYDGKAEMIPGAVAKQYLSRTDQNLDYTIAADYWPDVDPLPRYNYPRTLQIGDRGADVQHLQGVLHIAADGNFGPVTKMAVEHAQAVRHMTVDGIFGPLSAAAFG